jgi:signal transduction histidine kinase
VNTVTAFIRQHRKAIVDEWLSRAVKLPNAQTLAPPALFDHVPDIIDRLADAIDRRDETAAALENLPEQHASLRFRQGYDLRQVIAEYRLLREVIVQMYAERGDLSAQSRSTMKRLAVLHEQLDCAIADAVDHYALERDHARDKFVAILGHDLRDPLNTVVFQASALSQRTGDLDARTVNAVRRIAASGERMERMIRDLLDFARGHLGGRFNIVPTAFDARAFLTARVQEIADAHPDRDLQCVAASVSGDFHVEWDADRISQVITNLVHNALVHGRDPVVVEAADEGGHVSISVRNDGEIPSDALPRLFDPFSADRSEQAHGGLGLGLYIVQQIAHAHGGEVVARSAGGATMVRVRLPRTIPRTPSQVPLA